MGIIISGFLHVENYFSVVFIPGSQFGNMKNLWLTFFFFRGLFRSLSSDSTHCSGLWGSLIFATFLSDMISLPDYVERSLSLCGIFPRLHFSINFFTLLIPEMWHVLFPTLSLSIYICLFFNFKKFSWIISLNICFVILSRFSLGTPIMCMLCHLFLSFYWFFKFIFVFSFISFSLLFSFLFCFLLHFPQCLFAYSFSYPFYFFADFFPFFF